MMKMRHILYISLVLLIAGCTNEDNFSDTLSGKGKTPLLINATINTGKAQTRASGNSFDVGDELKAYLRHTNGGTLNNYTVVDADYAKKLVTITKTSTGFNTDSYWDDFSNSAAAATDLRTGGHGLHSFYGYCYNGGSLYSLTETSGVLTWTVGSGTPVDQSTATKVKNADILWSPEQSTITYIHGDTHDATHGLFTIPYTHAMSQVTVKVIADNSAGFVSGTNPLASTELILNAMNIHTTLTAPSCATPSTAFSPLIQTESSYIKNVKMYAKEPYPNGHEFWREFVAIVAPGTKLKEGEQILEIFNAHGNNYTVTITDEMLSTASGKWGNGLSGVNQIGTEGGKNYIVTQPGVNYYLTVTVQKSAVQAHSSLANWTDVNATAIGDIYFPDDVDVIIDDSYDGTEGSKSPTPVQVEAIDKDQFVDGASFSLFRVQATNDNTYNLGYDLEAPKDHVARLNEDYAFESISTFTNTGGDPDDYWTNAPELYWPNNSAKFYYRALAMFNGSTGVAPNIVNDIEKVGTIPSDKGTSVSQGGNDILWGTTPKHYGYTYQKTYEKSYPIPPRTHGVPIVFEHALSKVSFTLETTSDAAATVNLSEASFVVSGLYTSGTILIDNGEISNRGEDGGTTISANATDTPGTSTTLISNLIVVPQTFDVSDKVTITLPNESNAVYSIPLANCTVSGGNTSSAWERGKDYSYTIHVEKEKVQLKVLVKDWDVVNGSGNAALNW